MTEDDRQQPLTATDRLARKLLEHAHGQPFTDAQWRGFSRTAESERICREWRQKQREKP